MIISASRRTDIPAFYSEWFWRRLQEGYVLVRNPMNIHRVSKVLLNKQVVDGIVFWTKNPRPMFERLHMLDDYAYYFQYTLNPYGRMLEKNLPPLEQCVQTFRELSRFIGPGRVIWRYDPVILTGEITLQYHLEQFARLADKLAGYTRCCVFSFVDFYSKAQRNLRGVGAREIIWKEKLYLAEQLARMAVQYDLQLASCAEDMDLSHFGIRPSRCIDGELLASINGRVLRVEKDKNQRHSCGCAASVDIGAYNTCGHGCLYCYANYSRPVVEKNIALYDPASPLLCSKLTTEDVVVEKKAASLAVLEKPLF
ncbi:DUF1848 domain-containing protein [Desulfurispora thermophila]|uniref:DUF1848 domain-containing protein n=1 Tax=Desulfurispora thermophila TaxID=265470 RepID=UPI00036EECC8|nr:DUF1848 domain-containing protein [Desulfurispora thermophila]